MAAVMARARTYTIIGLGLIGGSLAKSLRLAEPEATLRGIDLDASTRAYMQEEGAIDRADATLSEAILTGTDVLLIATPPYSWGNLAEQLYQHYANAPAAAPSLMMDVGSIKAYANRCFAGFPAFVAAHPIAGSAFFGALYSTKGLFANKRVILCPAAERQEGACAQAEAFWAGLGSDVTRMDPEMHDRIYAHVSHLPQLLAFAVAAATLDEMPPETAYLDYLRLAGSSPSLWLGIFEHNPHLVDIALNYIRLLGHMIAELGSQSGTEASPSVPTPPPAGSAAMAQARRLIPRVLAGCLVSTVTMEEQQTQQRLASYAGAAFLEMVQPAMSEPEADLAAISEHAEAVAGLLGAVDQCLRRMVGALKASAWEEVLAHMEEARRAYTRHIH